MNTIMTYQEMHRELVSEWILVGDPEYSENLEVKRGRVLYHSRSRDDLYKKAVELKPRHSAIVYTGTLPPGTVVVL